MADSKLVPLCRVSDVAPGSIKKASAAGKELAVFNIDGKFFVTQDHCTHGPGLLHEGFIFGEEVECDFHGGRFHVPSGRATGSPCIDGLETWEAHIVDGQVCIDPSAVREPPPSF